MKKTVLSLFATSLITGCSTTTPPSPKPHETKYTFQCLLVSYPDSLFQELTFSFNDSITFSKISPEKQVANLFPEQQMLPSVQATEPLPIPMLTQVQIEEFLQNPSVEIVELPIVYASIGESVTNDQTKTAQMVIDADVVNGEIVYTKKPYKLGTKISIRVDKAEGTNITYQIHMMRNKFVGFDEYTTKEGFVIKMPYCEGRSIDTQITQPHDVWTTLGGLIHQQNNGPKIHEMIFFRIHPPTTEK